MSARARLSNLFVLVSAAWPLLGCDDPLKSASLIQDTRVLGARVEVTNDPKAPMATR